MKSSPYPIDNSTRSSLVVGIKDPANRKYWERFYDVYAGLLLSIAYRRGVGNQDAQDILMETMSDIAQAVNTLDYDRSKGGFRAWISTIMRRRLFDAYRKAQRHKLVTVETLDVDQLWDDANIPKPESDELIKSIDAEWLQQIREFALDRLRKEVSPQQFGIFEAVDLLGWDTEKVMQTFGVSRDVVYQTRHRVGPVFDALVKNVAHELDNPV